MVTNTAATTQPNMLLPHKTSSSHVVLTHVIEGYVIKESSQPFPVKPAVSTPLKSPEVANTSLESTPKMVSEPADTNSNSNPMI